MFYSTNQTDNQVLYCSVERSTSVVEHLFECSIDDVKRTTAKSNNEFFLPNLNILMLIKHWNYKNDCDNVNVFCIGSNYAILYILCIDTKCVTIDEVNTIVIWMKINIYFI